MRRRGVIVYEYLSICKAYVTELGLVTEKRMKERRRDEKIIYA
jgi:hypothetical protein